MKQILASNSSRLTSIKLICLYPAKQIDLNSFDKPSPFLTSEKPAGLDRGLVYNQDARYFTL
ncbi:MAG: hypothetical protein ACK4SO_07540 [Candidatus Kapaibacteriota bacterium]